MDEVKNHCQLEQGSVPSWTVQSDFGLHRRCSAVCGEIILFPSWHHNVTAFFKLHEGLLIGSFVGIVVSLSNVAVDMFRCRKFVANRERPVA